MRSSVVAGFAAAAICVCVTPAAAFSTIPSSALCSRGAVQGSLCKAPNALNTRRPGGGRGGSLQLRASGSPPPPPATGTKTLSKTEKSELNLQMWDAAKNGETETLVRLWARGLEIRVQVRPAAQPNCRPVHSILMLCTALNRFAPGGSWVGRARPPP